MLLQDCVRVFVIDINDMTSVYWLMSRENLNGIQYNIKYSITYAWLFQSHISVQKEDAYFENYSIVKMIYILLEQSRYLCTCMQCPKI